MTTIYLAALAFGVTLLLASLVLGGRDAGHDGGGDPHGGHDYDGDLGAWAPVTSLRFWVFFLAFGGAAGVALERLGTGTVPGAIAAGVIGWGAGVIAVKVVSSLRKNSVSSAITGQELIGTTGQLLLPASPSRIGKVRLDVKGRLEDYVAMVVEDGGELDTGTPVLVIAEGERGTLLVAKGEM